MAYVKGYEALTIECEIEGRISIEIPGLCSATSG